MYKKNLVSVIMPAYNSEKTIEESIQSVLNQTYKNFELIIIDDCSIDNTKNIIEYYVSRDSRVKGIYLNENKGSGNARNKGIEKSYGQYLAFLDSDDLWLANKLANQLKVMKENEYAFTFTSYYLKDKDNKKKIQVPKTVDYDDLLKQTVIGCLTVIIDRNFIKRVKMPLIRARQDTATWLSILREGTIAHGINEPLAIYRKNECSLSSNKIKMISKNWTVYRKLEKLSLAKSLCCLLSCSVYSFKKHYLQ